MHTFRPQATSNTLWAMAKLGYVPPVDTLEAAATQILADMRASVPQDVSNSLWAFASMRHHPGTPLLDAAAILRRHSDAHAALADKMLEGAGTGECVGVIEAWLSEDV